MRTAFWLRFLLISSLLALAAALAFSRIEFFSAQALRNDEIKLDAELLQLYRQHSSLETAAREASRQRIRMDKERATVGVILNLRDADEAAQTEIEAHGFQLRARIGDIAVVDVPIAELPELAALRNVTQLRAAKFKAPLSAHSIPAPTSFRIPDFANDAANVALKAPDARSNYGLSGRGILIGLIDSGIDWRHGDFRTVDGKTRVKLLWDMSDPSGSGPNGVGRIYNETEINAALQNNGTVAERDFNGHGSHVAGTAAGNGLGTDTATFPGVFTGVAPEADLIVVKATRSSNEQAYFADDDLIAALSFINSQAAALNKPFVINLGIGGHYSAHDGSDPIEQAIDNLLSSGKGKQVVIAAGNEGNRSIHAGGVLVENSEAVIPFTVTSKADGMIAVYPGSDALSAKIIKPNGTVIGPVALHGLITSDPDVELENAPGESLTEPKAVLVSFKQRLAGQWKLVLTGTRINNGRYDIWTQDAGETQLDAAVRDNLKSVSSPATARRAISVGNFVTKTEYIDQNGVSRIRTHQGVIGQLAVSSSLGPSRDGRLMPLLTAPGSYLASTRSADFTIDSFTGVSVSSEFLTNDGGRHYVSYGTSMAAATVTGTVALMLQANPNLTPDQIRRLLMRTVTNDVFTGASVSPQFGYGKLNTLAAVQAAAENIAAAEFVSVSGASFVPETVGAPEMIMSGFGANLSTTTAVAQTVPLPTTLSGVSVKLTDSKGATHLMPLFFVSPSQINYLVPANVALGMAMIEVVKADNSVLARGAISVNTLWPGLFTTAQNGSGIAAADVLRIKPNGDRAMESINTPIDLSTPGDRIYLQLYGTGLRGRSNLNNVKITLGGTPLNIEYAGVQPEYLGLDQINAVVPTSLAGRNRTLDLIMYVDGWAANVVQCKIK